MRSEKLINLTTQVVTQDKSLLYPPLIKQAVKAVPDRFFVDFKTLTIRIVDLEESAELNREYRGTHKPTNVLAFPTDRGKFSIPQHLGDILICAPLVISEAMKNEINPAHRLIHLAVHGVLHLLGFTHEEDSDGDEMEALEIEILSQVGIQLSLIHI